MLALPITNSWGFVYTNQENGSTTPGTSVTPGASDVEGSWTEIGPDASITTDIHYVTLLVMAGGTSTQSKQHLLDFGWDPAGGTSYVAFFSDLACGAAADAFGNNDGGRQYHFPCRIPAGSAIAVRVQGSNATAGTVRVLAYFYGKPSRPELWRPAAYSETLGYTSGTLGTSFTPGTTAWSAWTSLGATAKKHFWAQLGVQIDNGTQAARQTRVQLGIGDGTNMHVINDFWVGNNTSETMVSQLPLLCQWEIPAGATLYVRGNGSGAGDTGWNATAVLFGG